VHRGRVGQLNPLSTEDIRKMVREALREAMPEAKAAADDNVRVRIASDDDLNAFAREIAKADEAKRAAVLSGQMRFTLARNGGGGAEPRSGTHRLDKGVLTEAMVVEIGRANSRIIVGKSVAVTPLARDKAREVKLEIVRDKP
jgi:hypothetical protein